MTELVMRAPVSSISGHHAAVLAVASRGSNGGVVIAVLVVLVLIAIGIAISKLRR